MRVKINYKSLQLIFMLIVVSSFYFILGDVNDKLWCVVLSLLNGYVILVSTIRTIKENNVFSLINIANIFLFMIFVIRPMQIIICPDDIKNMHAFRMYAATNVFSIEEMPLAKASFIGFIGIVALNFSYFVGEVPRRMRLSIEDVGVSYNKRGLTQRQYISIGAIVLIALMSEMYFLYKAMILQSSIGIIDLAWVYAFSLIIMYLTIIYRKSTLFSYILIINCVVALAIAARRQYIVNVMLYYIIPLYYVGKNNKKDKKRIIIMAFALVAVVIVYGAIRRARIGYETGGILFELLDEFCMYDMLNVALKYLSDHGYSFFYGYNYLAIFSRIIPGLEIDPFDHMLTGIVLKNTYHGAIPTSLLGSLYFNFSYVGVAVGSIILAKLMKVIQDRLYRISVESVGYYTIAVCFIYDLIRVGDIGREFWTMMVSVVAFLVLKRIIPLKK